MNFNNTTTKREIHRGEIYYMSFQQQTGSEQFGARPVIVVSNEACNKFSSIVTIVPITSKQKKQLPTHVELSEATLPIKGTVLCEHVQSVSVERLLSYINNVDEETMNKITNAIAIQLSLQSTTSLDTKCDNDVDFESLKVLYEKLKFEFGRLQERERVFRELYNETIKKQ